MDAKLLYPCGTCGWNASHSSAYHAQQTSNPATFTMSTTTYPGKVAVDGDAAVSALTASSATAAALAAAMKEGRKMAMKEVHLASEAAEKQSSDPDEVLAAGLLHQIMSSLVLKD